MHNITNLRQALRFLAIAKERIKTQEASEAALKVELRAINATLDDPRTDLTMTACEVIVALKKQVAQLQENCISGFYHERVPQFRQGYPNHEVLELVTAKEVQAYVDKIEDLQSKSVTLATALDRVSMLLCEANPNYSQEYLFGVITGTHIVLEAALAAFKGDSNG